MPQGGIALRNSQEVEKVEGMALLQVQRREYAQAIASYRHILELRPNDHDAKVGLARALAFAGQYDAALQTFHVLLMERPDDTDALEGVARVETWAGHSAEALLIFQDLTKRYPANPDYALGLARVETNLHRYPEARKTLTALLAAHPRNSDAQLQLAYLDLFEGHQAEALRRFNRLIRENPSDLEALKGNVRIAYYRGDLVYAHNLAEKIVADEPRDVAALLLLAHLERALHHRRKAYALLHRAKSLEPHNPEARELEDSLGLDARPTLRTSASFAREIGSGSSSSAEDLRALGFESTWGLLLLPRSESYLSLDYLPSQSPSGGVQGAVGPSQILYRQTTYLTPQLTVRGGFGLARFGPGDLIMVATQGSPITSAGTRPLAFANLSYTLGKKLTLEVTAARAAVTYTPTSVRLGVMEDRLSAGLDYRWNAKTDLRLEPFLTDAFTIRYNHLTGPAGILLYPVNEADQNRGSGTSITFERKVIHKPAGALDVGYSGLAYGLVGGLERPYLGMFNPGFYQRHYLTAHIAGKIHGPLSCDFSAGGGVQQVERGTPLKPAMLLSPALTLKASARLAVTLAYTHYNSSQSLGTLRGNAARLSTDWRF
jgi:tetratricopeptide (TPR) repeat protein